MEAESRSGGSGSSSFRPLLLVLLFLPGIFVLLFLPSFLSHGSRPSLLKNGWDTLNLVLVLFAILCGLFAPRNKDDDDYEHPSAKSTQAPLADPCVSSDTEHRTVGMRRRMRSSSSYPDLRHEAWWGPPDADAWRFSDDIQLYRASPRRSTSSPAKTIPVDTFEIRKSPTLPSRSRSQSPPPPPSQPPPPPPPPPPSRRRAAKKLPPSDLPQESTLPLRSRSPPRSMPPPPPPPPPPMSPVRVEIKRMERKKSGGAKDIASALAQFYQKKKKRSKSKKIYVDETSVPDTDTGSVSAPPSAPPPPPPLPPPSMFQQLFKKSKGSKRHQHHSFPPPPPPPPAKKHESNPSPPPPPQNPLRNRKQKPRSSSRYPLPPSPLRPSNQFMPYYSIPMPPPPPPPPIVDEADESGKEGEQGKQFCPSPDVNNKAEMFIARFRAGLHLEKMNSIKLKQEQEQQQQQQKQEEEITVAAV